MGLRKDLGETGSLGKTGEVGRGAGQGWRTNRATQVPTDAHSTGEGVRARRVHSAVRC